MTDVPLPNLPPAAAVAPSTPRTKSLRIRYLVRPEEIPCRVCGIVHPFDADHFPMCRRTRWGLETRCLRCQRALSNAWHAKQRAQAAADNAAP